MIPKNPITAFIAGTIVGAVTGLTVFFGTKRIVKSFVARRDASIQPEETKLRAKAA